MRVGAGALLALAAGLLGCGLGEKVMDPCQALRANYEMAARKVSAMRGRRVPVTDPYYQLSTREVRDASTALSNCEARYRD